MPRSRPRTIRLGSHISTAGGVDRAPANAEEIGAECMQVFTRNQRRWESKPITDEQARRYRSELARRDLGPVIAHDGYLINLAARDRGTLNRSRRALLDEIHRADLLGIRTLVAHPGSHLGRGVAVGIRHFVKNLDGCIEEAGDASEVAIALENTAGQGTNLGWELSQIRDMIAASRHPGRLAMCLDTCHAFAAGYDIRQREGYERTMEEIARIVGLDRMAAVHLNDSRTPLGSRRDRHADLGKGHLGLEPFRLIVNDPRWAGLPGCLETPGGPPAWQGELELLRAMRGEKAPTPAALLPDAGTGVT